MKPIRVALGATTLASGVGGVRHDGIGVYTGALFHHLGRAGCAVQAYAYPPLGGGAGCIRLGRALPRSFEAATLQDWLTPRSRGLAIDADLFHATDYRITRMDCPVVATLHDALTIRHPAWCNPRLRKLKNWVQKTAARKADHVIALSHAAVPELLAGFGIDERRISVVPCGVDAEWLQPPPEAEVDATLMQLGVRRGYYLSVGTLQPRKNFARMLAAYLALPAAVRAARQLVLVGAPGWRCGPLLARLRAARAAGHGVLWLPNVADRGTLRHLYEAAGVFVFPSLYEGFGLPMVEAFAAGVPVVASNAGALPEVAAGAALEVDPLDTVALAAAMRALATDEGLRSRQVRAGRRRAAALTWQATAERTAAVYRAVLAH